MRILITGASGFIGKHVLANPLLAGHEVMALVRTIPELAPDRSVHWLRGNLENSGQCMDGIERFDPQVCVHLAWEGIPDFSYSTSERNLALSMGFLKTISERTKCRRFVISGSCFEYGALDGICAEDRPSAINSYFSWAKHSLYHGVSFMAKVKNIEIIWLRFFYVYGPGQRAGSLIPAVIKALREGLCPPIKNPFNANDFVYAGDVADAVCMAINAPAPSGIYNIGSGAVSSVLDVCRTTECLLNNRNSLSESLAEMVAPTKTLCFWADSNKSRQLLGWQAKIPLREGLKKCLENELGRNWPA